MLHRPIQPWMRLFVVLSLAFVGIFAGCTASVAKQLHAGSIVFTEALTAEHVAYTLGDLKKADIAAALPVEIAIDAALTQGQAAALSGNTPVAKVYLDTALSGMKQYLATMQAKATGKSAASLAAWQITLTAVQAFVDSIPPPIPAPTTAPVK
jgi:hypothetical protein